MVGTGACTGAEVGFEAAAWPLRETGWRRQTRRWTSPGQSGSSKTRDSAGWDWSWVGERPLTTVGAQRFRLQSLRMSLNETTKYEF